NFRIISDHLRACVFLISEGIMPSNEGRGYILRRLIRRAERFAKIMGSKDAVLYKLVPKVFEIFKDTYPEIKLAEKDIISVLKFEEEGFLQTLETGEKFLGDILNKHPKRLPGAEAFRLYETYGFPLELTKEIALKKGIEVDEKGFDAARIKAQSIAKAGWKSSGEKDASIFQKAEDGLSVTEFISGDLDFSKTAAFINSKGDNIEKLKAGDIGYMAFDKTIFYAESGGQVGDTGFIYKNEDKIAEVLDTQKTASEIVFHKVKALKNLEIKIGDKVVEKTDFKRHRTAVHHTATHVINAALRKVFGPSTRQAGSFVDSERFRFDYTVAHTPTKEEIAKVEAISNEAIKENYKVSTAEKSLKEAKEMNAVMLLGEKYKDPARLVLINKDGFDNAKDHYSLELCGGTHLTELSSIGGIKIIKDSSVSKGIRRIEGVAGPGAIEYFSGVWNIAESIALKLSSGIEDIEGRIDKLLENEKKLKAEIENIKRNSFKSQSSDALSTFDLNGEAKFIFFDAQDAEMKTLRLMVDDLKQKKSSGIIFVFSNREGKFSFIVSCSDDLKDSFDASEMAKEAGKLLSGKGGGRKDFAQGGGTVPKDIEEFKKQLVETAKKYF
ncbi:MAG: alanine--tRNA ligase, partial [Elusimicrobiales bacterium]|nr:alanine--tRNA ligase [Elusimicrobiales bacterium]